MEIEEPKVKEVTKESFQITREEYSSITQNLIQIMKKEMESNETEISPENLALLLIENQVERFDNMDQLSKYEKLVKGIIKRMAQKDRIFQIMKNNDNEQMLRFHPSYNP